MYNERASEPMALHAELLACDWELVDEPAKPDIPRSESSDDGVSWFPCRDTDDPMVHRYFRRTGISGCGWGDELNRQAMRLTDQTAAIARLERELAEAKRNYGPCDIQCGREGEKCNKPRGHKGDHCAGNPCRCGT